MRHASLCPPDLLQRMAKLKIVAVVQPQFVTSDTWTPQRIGLQRSAWAYPFRSMIEAGVPLALSSDCPVEKLDAFATLAAAVGRGLDLAGSEESSRQKTRVPGDSQGEGSTPGEGLPPTADRLLPSGLGVHAA